ncbi:TRAP transporter substrate-binding protein [Castellaniella sp.]|uniref:TRAP transporter substrate-binding protein n=1 Tax=Castellaniella sp. TaxID=1955812 RepID=UPI003560AAD4
MNKNFIVAIGFAVAGLLVAARPAVAENMPKVELSAVGNLGITTQYNQIEAPFWTEWIPEATGGAVTATVRPWNEMGLTGQEVFRLLRLGTYDVGNTVMGFLAGDAPIHEGTDLPGLTSTIAELREVTDAFRPVLEEFYAKDNQVKVLALTSYQRQILYCRDDLKGLADLKGRKIRVGGTSQADFIGYFGATGIPMPFAEVQQALATGVLDCAITGTLGGYKAKWNQPAKYLYNLPISWASSIQGMNINAWNRLSPEEQTILMQQVRKLEEAIDEQNVREDELGIQCNTGGPCSEGPASDMKLIPVSDEDVELKREVLLNVVLPKWAQRCGDACADSWNQTVGKILDLQAKAK